MIEILGWIGGILFAICAIPAAYEAYSTKKTDGLGWTFIGIWFLAELLSIIYMLGKPGIFIFPVFFNYILNVLCLSVIIAIKLKHNKKP